MKLLLPISILITLFSCSKEPVLPSSSNTGENTFGFEFNDTIFIPAQPAISYYKAYWQPPTLTTSTGNFKVGVENRKDFEGIVPSLGIQLNGVNSTGVYYNFNYEETVFEILNYNTSPTSERRYFLDTNQVSWISIYKIRYLNADIIGSFRTSYDRYFE
jgi:hypothetical protein